CHKEDVERYRNEPSPRGRPAACAGTGYPGSARVAESRTGSPGPLPDPKPYPTYDPTNSPENPYYVCQVPRPDAAGGGPARPRWDGSTLWFGTKVVRKYKRTPERQGRLLRAFEDAGWPRELPNPFRGEADPEGVLSQTLRDLKRDLPANSPLWFGQTD